MQKDVHREYVPCNSSSFLLCLQAQKPWAKRYVKVQKIKKDYHNQCKVERSATNAENNARGDSALSADQVMGELVELCSSVVELREQRTWRLGTVS